MKIIEIRRHSWRKHGGGSQLSQRGVDFARLVGASMGPFDTVATSVVPRARETAIAMGFAVDVELVTLCADPGLYREAPSRRWWEEQPNPFSALASVIRDGAAHRRYANSMAALWRDLLTPLREGGRVLVIGHSGEIEASLVACFPDADHSTWGAPFGPCEGVRLTFGGIRNTFLISSSYGCIRSKALQGQLRLEVTSKHRRHNKAMELSIGAQGLDVRIILGRTDCGSCPGR